MPAERELIYRIRFVQDPASAGTLKALAKEGVEAERILQRTSKRRQALGAEDTAASARETAARTRDEQRAARESERVQRQKQRDAERAEREAARMQARQEKDAERAAKSQERATEKAARESARIKAREEKDAERATAKAEKLAEREAKAKERAAEKAAREQARIQAREEKEKERAAAKAEKDAQREAKAKERAAAQAAKAQEREAKRAADAEQRERDRVQAAYEREGAALERTAETNAGKLANARRQLSGNLLEGTEGILRMTRGFVALGMVGEKDLEKLARGLVTLQSGIDLVAGAMKTWMKGAEVVHAYREAVETATAAEAALEALRKRSATANVAGGLGQAAGRIGGGAGGQIAGNAGGAVAGRLIAGGGATAAAGGTATAGGGAAAAAGFGGTILAFLAAVAATGVALKVLWETVRGASTEVDSWSMKIATWEVEFAEFVHAVDLGTKAVEAAEKRREKILEDLGRREAQREAMAPLQGRALATSQAVEDVRLKFNRNPDQFKPVQLEEAANDARYAMAKARADLAKTNSPTDRGLLMERQVELATRVVQLTEQRFQVERDLFQKSKQAAEETLRIRQDELRTIREQLKERTESLESAAEKFGQLSPAEQARAIEAKVKADKFGAQSLTKDERATLRGIGLQGTSAAARQGDIIDAERAGFSRFFGAEERRQIRDLRGQERTTTLEIKGQRELLVRLEQEEQVAVDSVAKQLAELVKQREDLLTEKIKAEVNARLGEINRQNNSQARQKSAAAG